MFELHPLLESDTLPLGTLPLCRVLLMNDAQYPWLILVPQRTDVTEIFQLKGKDRQQLELESSALAELMMTHFQGDKFNIGTLGNIVSQLHVHHIVRFKNDAAWPQPVWGAMPRKPYAQDLLDQTQKTFSDLLTNIAGFKKW